MQFPLIKVFSCALSGANTSLPLTHLFAPAGCGICCRGDAGQICCCSLLCVGIAIILLQLHC